MSEEKHVVEPSKLRCEICDYCQATGSHNYSSHYKAAPDAMPLSPLTMRVAGTPRYCTLHKGRALCNVCLANEKESLTDAKIVDNIPLRSKETLAKYETGGYVDEIGSQLVYVTTYKPTHPKIRAVVDEPRTCSILEGYTAKEQADWIEEYSKSLVS